MGSRVAVIVPLLALVVGIVGGAYAAVSFADPPASSEPERLQLGAAEQTDYILNVADAYAVDGNLKLAQDRLARLRDPQIATRVEAMALEHARERNRTAANLAWLAVSLGSEIHSLAALYVTATPTPTRTVPPIGDPVFSNIRATNTRTLTPSVTPLVTQEPVYVVVPNDHPYIILPTDTPTITRTPTKTRTRRPPTPTPTPTDLPTATPIPPPPPVEFLPSFPDRWPPGVYFEPADVQPGQQYWHLKQAIYCDFVENDFGCPDRPGNRSGTSIYVMDNRHPINVIRPDGKNVGNIPSQVGDMKGPGDVCRCSFAILVSNYKISVAGAPSDAIGGFSLYTVGGHVLAGHAHVRYFLYFEYITR